MKNIYGFILAAIFLFTGKVFAQENYLFSQNFLQRYSYTPAGVTDSSSVGLFYRKQWLGLDEAPETFGFAAHLTNGKNGAGIRAFRDKAGLFAQTLLQFSYGYALKIDEKQFLQFGTSIGFRSLNLNTSGLSDKDFSDPVLLRARNNTRFVADFGISYRYAPFSLSLTFPHLYRKSLKSDEVSVQTVPQAYHFILAAAYDFVFEALPLTLTPSVFYKQGAVRGGQTDVSLKAVWDKKFWAGALYRSDFGYAAFAGFSFKNFALGYALEISPQERGARGGSSHEILLSYQMPNLKRKTKMPEADTTALMPTVIEKTDTLKTPVTELVKADSAKTEKAAEFVYQKGKTHLLRDLIFVENTAELLPKSKDFLDKLAEELDKMDLTKVEIIAHTDKTHNTLTGKILSEQRAKAVTDYLVKQGISRKILFGVGFGASKPLVVNPQNEAEEKQNERIELFIE